MKEFIKYTGKSILKKLIIFGIVLAVIAAPIAGCSIYNRIKNAPSGIDAKMYKQYKSYKRYDYHLKCFDKEDYITEQIQTKYEDYRGVKYKGKVSLQKISGVDENQFVYAYWERTIKPGNSVKYFNYETVMQNPDNYIDVIKDWTITKIEIIGYGNAKESDYKEDESDKKIISSTTDEEVLSDLKKCILNEKDEEEFKKFYTYSGDYYSDGYRAYIRVHFAESDNIVWETEFDRYLSDETNSSLIYVDTGRNSRSYWNNSTSFSLIYKYPNLKNWIDNAFEHLDSN